MTAPVTRVLTIWNLTTWLALKQHIVNDWTVFCFGAVPLQSWGMGCLYRIAVFCSADDHDDDVSVNQCALKKKKRKKSKRDAKQTKNKQLKNEDTNTAIIVTSANYVDLYGSRSSLLYCAYALAYTFMSNVHCMESALKKSSNVRAGTVTALAQTTTTKKH